MEKTADSTTHHRLVVECGDASHGLLPYRLARVVHSSASEPRGSPRSSAAHLVQPKDALGNGARLGRAIHGGASSSLLWDGDVMQAAYAVQ